MRCLLPPRASRPGPWDPETRAVPGPWPSQADVVPETQARTGRAWWAAARLWAYTVRSVKTLLPRRARGPARKPGSPFPGLGPPRPLPETPAPAPDSALRCTERTTFPDNSEETRAQMPCLGGSISPSPP